MEIKLVAGDGDSEVAVATSKDSYNVGTDKCGVEYIGIDLVSKSIGEQWEDTKGQIWWRLWDDIDHEAEHERLRPKNSFSNKQAVKIEAATLLKTIASLVKKGQLAIVHYLSDNNPKGHSVEMRLEGEFPGSRSIMSLHFLRECTTCLDCKGKIPPKVVERRNP